MKNKMLKAALDYRSLDISVIPVRKDKEPYIDWKRYQEELPAEDQIRKWWLKWPNANIGIICGKISGIDVLNIDSEEGLNMIIDEYLSNDFHKIPLVETPKGYHLYFKHSPGLINEVRVLPGCDLCTKGGYVIAPPSKNIVSRIYSWSEGLTLSDIEMISMPEKLYDAFENPHSSQLNENEEKYSSDTVGKNRSSSTMKFLVKRWTVKGLNHRKICRLAMKWNAKLPEPLVEKDVKNIVNSIFFKHLANSSFDRYMERMVNKYRLSDTDHQKLLDLHEVDELAQKCNHLLFKINKIMRKYDKNFPNTYEN